MSADTAPAAMPGKDEIRAANARLVLELRGCRTLAQGYMRNAEEHLQDRLAAESRALAAEAALAAERGRVGQLVRLLDQQMGTPCEQIRYQQDIDNLRAVTTEAIDEIESWGAYASEYFRDKHDLTGTVADLRARAAAIRAQGE